MEPTAAKTGESAAEAGGIGRLALSGAVLAVALVLAWVPFGADVQRAERVPDLGAIDAATAKIRAEFAPGDAVVVEPTWYFGPWRSLQNIGPGTEQWPFPALLDTEDLDPVEALSFKRLWVLSLFDRPADAPEVLGADVGTRTDFGAEGHVALARYELAPVRRIRTMSRELSKIEVARGWGGAAPELCRFQGDRQRCGHEGWYDVWVDDHIVYHEHVRWPYTHPSPNGGPFDITWRGLQAEEGGQSTWLYVRVGFSMDAVRHAEGKPVTLTIMAGGAEVDRFELEPHRYWMERRAIRLAGPAGGAKRTDVQIRMNAPDNGWRETMMEVDVLDSLPDALRNWATHVVE